MPIPIGGPASRPLALCLISGCLVVSTGCPPQDGANGPPDQTDSQLPAYRLIDAEAPPFVVTLETDRPSGVPGTAFHLTAQAGVSDATFHFTSDEGATADGPTATFSFATPGFHDVDVTATDASGRRATARITLVIFDPAAAPPAVTRSIQPDHGMPGTLVRIFSPALNDPSVDVRIEIGTSAPLEHVRPAPGQANVIIPLDAAIFLTGPTPVQIRLKAGDQTVDDFVFLLSPPATLSGPPGAHVRKALEVATQQARLMGDIVPQTLSLFDPTDMENALFVGLARMAEGNLTAVSEQLPALLDQLDAATLALFDQLLVANGVTQELLASAPPISGKSLKTARLLGDDVVDICCTFRDAAELVDNVAGAMETAAPFLALGALAAGPAGVPLVTLANVCLNAGVASDIAGLLKKLIPKVDDSLLLAAAPTSLQSTTEISVLTLRARLTVEFNVCTDTLDTIIGELAKQAAKNLLNRVSRARVLADIIQKSPYYHGFQDEQVQEFTDYMEQVVSSLAKAAVKASGLDQTLAAFADKFCQLKERDTPEIEATPAILTVDPAGAGLLSNFRESKADFQCTGGTGAIVRAQRPCGLRTLTGQISIGCGCEDGLAYLTEDSVRTVVGPDQGRRFFAFHNTHPSRHLVVCTLQHDEDLTTGAQHFEIDQTLVPPNSAHAEFGPRYCWTSTLAGPAGRSTHIIQAFLGCEASDTSFECASRAGPAGRCFTRLADQWLNPPHEPLAGFGARTYPPCPP